MIRLLTDTADGFVTIPMAFAVAAILLLGRQRRIALGWAMAVGGVWGAMLVLKFAGYVLAAAVPGSPLSGIDLVTPSGHVASATVVYGGLAGLLLPRPGTFQQRAFAAAALVAATIGATRVQLYDHSLAEVLVGGGVGLAGIAVLTRIVRMPAAWPLPLPLLAASAAILLAGHGAHLSLEPLIRRAAAEALGGWRPAAELCTLPQSPISPRVCGLIDGGS